MKLSDQEFDSVVKRAVRRIPREIRRHIKNVIISVQKRPSRELIHEVGLKSGVPLFGLYRGNPLQERSVTFPPLYPDTILIFQEPLELVCRTIEELEEQIEITVVHEVAHFIGISDERLVELGYG
jgi:predicted Zn-dependent protease with MMP-like domain